MMLTFKKFSLLGFLCILCLDLNAQNQQDSTQKPLDSLALVRQKLVADSLKAVEDSVRAANQAIADSIQREADILQARVDSIKRVNKLYADSLRANAYPVVLRDTLLYIYSGMGNLSIKDRAAAIVNRLQNLVNRLDFDADSLFVRQDDAYWNIIHKDEIVMTVTPEDSVAEGKAQRLIAQTYLRILKENLIKQREYKSMIERIQEIGLTLTALLIVFGLFRLTNFLFRLLLKHILDHREKYFKGFKYQNYEVLTSQRQLRIAFFLLKSLRLLTHILMLYMTLPIIFSIFPATRGYANILLSYIITPLRAIGAAVVGYIPNLFVIAIIYVCTLYTVRFFKFIAYEIQEEKLIIKGFYSDWARPTYNIIRVISYAFMFVLIFPYLPGSESPIFQGVTVFVGVLFSLGSSSAISNMVAGIVITYMRPFRLGDRVKIGELVGDVIEKNLLVTRIRTLKNEDITIPNASILNGHTINFTSSSQLILHATITIGYDVPWRTVHELLLKAADKTASVMENPRPFVLQTSLDDFYVSYEINVYTQYVKSFVETYSELHQNIQDAFNEAGVEIMSPHYRAIRDGGQSTIPAHYLPEEYVSPAIKIMTEQLGKDKT